MESTLGQVVIVTKANIYKIKWKGRAYIFIIMEKLIQVNLNKEIIMEVVSFKIKKESL
jgi:hypothetical protein